MQIAAQKSDWQTQPLPESRTSVSLDRLFTEEEMGQIKTGLIPQEMEDKWFIYWDQETLRFHRSWTGICIYVVRFVVELNGGRMVAAQVNRDLSQYSCVDDEEDVRMISYLIDLLLLRRPVGFPSEGQSGPEKFLKTWSNVGRAMFGDHPDGDED